MKLSTHLSTSLASGAFLLAGLLALAQTASATNNMRPRDAATGQSSGRQAQSGSAPGMAVNEQGSRGHNGLPAQSIAVDHAGGNGVRRADSPSGQHNASRSGPQGSGVNPMYEGSKDSSVKTQKANGNAVSAKNGNNSMQRKHIAGVKYQDRMSPGHNAPGMAVNEQGSHGPAQVYKRH